eukprot:scaffold119030_cov21-Prasinocladus_malaysianus.AAC.1
MKCPSKGNHLIGPVAPAKLLDGLVGAPGQLQGEVHPAGLLSPPHSSNTSVHVASRTSEVVAENLFLLISQCDTSLPYVIVEGAGNILQR